MAINERQERFCQEYMIDKNATQAYIRAYGCSYNAAKVGACKLLTNPNIRQRIEQMRDEERTRLRVDRQRLLDEAAKIAFLNPADVIDLKTGYVRPTARREDLAAISEIRADTEASLLGGRTNVSVRLYSKMDAIKFLHSALGDADSAEGGGVRIVDDTGPMTEAERQEMMDLSGLDSIREEETHDAG